MRRPAENLEPAVRDPRKLRLTAFILVAVMAVSGVLILVAYNRDAARRAEDDRPAFVTRLRTDKHDFKLWRQDESEASLLDLLGDVFVIVPVVFEQPESWSTTRQVLLDLKQRYGTREDFHIVCVTLDPENESPEKLGEYASDLGAELPFWWLAGAREESVHKYFKNVLQSGFMPKEEDGTWEFDPTFMLVDRDGHLRQPTVRARKPNGRELNFRNKVPFNFEQAAEWDEQGKSEGLEKSNVETLKELLFKTAEELLATPAKQEP
ncbi:electron transporter SCO1/senC [Haloferula helveola]|uniref:Electron transporter SCO1/senC n=1 Tax=Haloferula helveola TaxID=490095 RepID=A0ABM7RIA7_9BACT|nr:electron transporter SCO1/senC [Haloferula helveola]